MYGRRIIKAIYYDWEENECCGVEEIAVFSEDKYGLIDGLLSELKTRWPSSRFIVDNYRPPSLNPSSIDELDIGKAYFDDIERQCVSRKGTGLVGHLDK